MVDIALKISFEKPVYLRDYTDKFLKAYAKEINSVVPSKSPQLKEIFISEYSRVDRGVKDRRLPPDFTGATRRSIDTEVTRVDSTTRTPQSLIRVGYLNKRFRGRMSIYVPSIEGGWGEIGSAKKPFRKGKTVGSFKLASKKREQQLRKKYFAPYPTDEGRRSRSYEVYLPDSPYYTGKTIRKYEGFNRVIPSDNRGEGKSEFDKRIEKYARRKLGIDPKKEPDRLWGLKQSILAGAPGRNIVPKVAGSTKVIKVWDTINSEIARNLNKSFTQTPKKQEYVKNFRIRGA